MKLCVACKKNIQYFDWMMEDYCPVCEFMLGLRKDFPSFEEYKNWAKKKGVLLA